MVTWQSIFGLFDRYSRIARLYPAILAIAPCAWSAVILFPKLVTSLANSVIVVVVVIAALYFISGIARSRGKAIEPELLRRWGGWPTTIFLRHRDATLDGVTKARYQQRLSRLCGGLRFPAPDDEASDPAAADAVYRSATKKLIEKRRDAKYRQLHYENESYGFRRNLLGLRPIAITLAALAALGATIAWYLLTPDPRSLRDIIGFGSSYPRFPALVVVDLLDLVGWGLLVREFFVRQAAEEYAHALFRTLDA